MSGRPTIRTLADLNRRPTSSDGSDDSDNPQEYYTGGEKSGMIVQDPTRGRGNNTDDIFDQARQMGAMPGPHVPPPSSSSSSSFAGIGRLLSSEETTAPPPPPVRQVPAERLVHTIIFWNNGFTVDEGPLRRFDDPENASFLESIRRQECPLELEPSDRRTEVNVNLTRAQKDYVEPVGPKKMFQGVGRTLGSSSEETPPVQTPHDTSSSATPIDLSVDESQPITTVQLRLADGTRMVARFNTSHTVGHIRGFIDASRPGAARNYQLQTGFPPKILSDASLTIDQAGLSNSVIIQKI